MENYHMKAVSPGVFEAQCRLIDTAMGAEESPISHLRLTSHEAPDLVDRLLDACTPIVNSDMLFPPLADEKLLLYFALGDVQENPFTMGRVVSQLRTIQDRSRAKGAKSDVNYARFVHDVIGMVQFTDYRTFLPDGHEDLYRRAA